MTTDFYQELNYVIGVNFMRLKISKRTGGFLQNTVIRLCTFVFLCALAPHAMAANKGNISAAVNTFIIGAIVAVLISLVFALQRNQNGQLAGLKTGKFFLLLSILILIVFVTATAAFFIFV